ncbi:MAG: hypothetical protein MI673_08155 [Thiotrichales bacterium]|nr:hypothetical protein [Thiotrichales bacterium]
MLFSVKIRKYLIELGLLGLLSGQILSVVHAYEHLDAHDEAGECIDCPVLKQYQHLAIPLHLSTANEGFSEKPGSSESRQSVQPVSGNQLIRAPPFFP